MLVPTKNISGPHILERTVLQRYYPSKCGNIFIMTNDKNKWLRLAENIPMGKLHDSGIGLGFERYTITYENINMLDKLNIVSPEELIVEDLDYVTIIYDEIYSSFDEIPYPEGVKGVCLHLFQRKEKLEVFVDEADNIKHILKMMDTSLVFYGDHEKYRETRKWEYKYLTSEGHDGTVYVRDNKRIENPVIHGLVIFLSCATVTDEILSDISNTGGEIYILYEKGLDQTSVDKLLLFRSINNSSEPSLAPMIVN